MIISGKRHEIWACIQKEQTEGTHDRMEQHVVACPTHRAQQLAHRSCSKYECFFQVKSKSFEASTNYGDKKLSSSPARLLERSQIRRYEAERSAVK